MALCAENYVNFASLAENLADLQELLTQNIIFKV